MEFNLTVQAAQPYQVHLRQQLHDVTLAGIETGGTVMVKIDPDDANSLLVWGKAA